MPTVHCRQFPDPYSCDWLTWAATVAGFNSGIEVWLDPEAPWQHFAQQFVLVEARIPGPELFSDWQTWADAVMSAKQM